VVGVPPAVFLLPLHSPTTIAGGRAQRRRRSMSVGLEKRDFAPLAIGVVLSGGLALTAMSCLGPAKIPDGLGSAIIAWRSFDRWEDRKRREQQAEVAGAALVAASELWTGLRTATSKEGWSEAARDHDYVEHLFEMLGFVRLDRFRAARIQVETFLSPDANDALERLYALRDTIWNLLEAVQSKCGSYGVIEANTEGVNEIFDALQGSKMLATLEQHVEAAKQALRHYVLYQSPPG
jgi:hypothetical protein